MAPPPHGLPRFPKGKLLSNVYLAIDSFRSKLGGGESLLNLWRRTVDLRRPDRARNEGTTGPRRLDDTRCTTYKRRWVTVLIKINILRPCVVKSTSRLKSTSRIKSLPVCKVTPPAGDYPEEGLSIDPSGRVPSTLNPQPYTLNPTP